MNERAKLRRPKQCAKCPWKKKTNPHEIPDGYSVDKHRALERTIARDAPGPLSICPSLNAMACHESPLGDEDFCVGWLVNQLGPGNNIGLRFRMLKTDLSEMETFGEQHESFEDTLPG